MPTAVAAVKSGGGCDDGLPGMRADAESSPAVGAAPPVAAAPRAPGAFYLARQVRRRPPASLCLFILLAVGVTRRPAHALGFDADFFKPTTASTGTFCEENGLTVAAGRMDVSVATGYAHKPVVLSNQLNGAAVGDVVRDRVTTTLAASLGITDTVDLGFRLAAVVRQVGSVDADIAADEGVPQHPRTTALGDTDLIVRWAMVRVERPRRRFRLTLMAPLTLPTGAEDALSGSGKFAFRPRVIAGWHTDSTAVAASVGFAYTPGTEVPSSALVVGKAVVAGLGFSYAVMPGSVWFQAETSLTLGMDNSVTGVGTAATQLMVGPRALLPSDIILQVGLGKGITRAAGSPQWSGMITLARLWGAP